MNVFWKWKWMCCDFNEWVLVKINECVLEVTMNVFWKWQWMCCESDNECVLEVIMNVFWKWQWMCFGSYNECVLKVTKNVCNVSMLVNTLFYKFISWPHEDVTHFWLLHVVCTSVVVIWARCGRWCARVCIADAWFLILAWKCGLVSEVDVHFGKLQWWGSKMTK